MGTYTRGQLPHLTNDILKHCSSYEVFQAVSLLETSLGLGSGDEVSFQRMIDLAPAPEISVPKGELRRCDIDDQGRFRLELNLLGLFGVDSPLPQYFNDITSRDGDGRDELRAFLEMFNKRLYALCYLAWKKFNLFSGPPEHASIYHRYLSALSGGAHQDGRFDYAGILGSRIKSAQGLAATLEDYLGYPVTPQENVPVWINIEDQDSLGSELCLGDNTILGNRIMDVSSKILITIGPIPIDVAKELLPGHKQARQLTNLIREYLDPAISYEIVLQVIAGTNYQSSLGTETTILGWTSCLGQPTDQLNHICLTDQASLAPQPEIQIPAALSAAA